MKLIIDGFKSHEEIQEFLEWHRHLELKDIKWNVGRKSDIVAQARLPINKSDKNGEDYG